MFLYVFPLAECNLCDCLKLIELCLVLTTKTAEAELKALVLPRLDGRKQTADEDVAAPCIVYALVDELTAESNILTAEI